MTFRRSAESQAKAAIESILTSASAQASLVERLVEELSAAHEAEQAALQARSEAEHAAVQQLAAAEAVARTELERERADHEALRQTIDGLRAHADAVAVAAQAEVQAIRAELTAARAELHERTSSLDATGQRLKALEEAHELVRRALDDNVARLASEALDRAALVEQLAFHRSDRAPLARLRRSLQAFAGLTRASDLLEAFIAQLATEFDRVALFTVREDRLEGSRSLGIEPTTDVSNLVIPLTIDSALTHAAANATTAVVESGSEGPMTGLLGPETYCVVAIPVVTREQVVAVAYAEVARDISEDDRLVALQIGEALVDWLIHALVNTRRLPMRDLIGEAAPPSTSPSYASPCSSPTRAVDRVRAPEAFEVLVDGAAAQLVDVSTLGAQILSSRSVRPNHQVRMQLPHANQLVLCQGRIVWATFEMVPSGGRYRAGVQFTSVDAAPLEAFVNQLAASHRAPVSEPGEGTGLRQSFGAT